MQPAVPTKDILFYLEENLTFFREVRPCISFEIEKELCRPRGELIFHDYLKRKEAAHQERLHHAEEIFEEHLE